MQVWEGNDGHTRGRRMPRAGAEAPTEGRVLETFFHHIYDFLTSVDSAVSPVIPVPSAVPSIIPASITTVTSVSFSAPVPVISTCSSLT